MDPEIRRAIENDERFEITILTQGLMGAGDLATCRQIRDQERSRGIVRGLAQIAVEQGLLNPSHLASMPPSPGGLPPPAAATSPATPSPPAGFQEAPRGLEQRSPLAGSSNQGSTPAMTPGGTEVSLPSASLNASRGGPASDPPVPAPEEVGRRTDAEIDCAILGSNVAGFQILDVLGRGAMGTVFRARQTSLDRDVAFKVLASRYANDAEFIERFHREAKAAGRFNHPNVVSAIDCGTAQINGLEIHYFVMELVEGKSLSEIMRARGPLPELEALGITRAVLDALGRAHDAGLVHRDVKPENILIDTEQNPKLADLGLAKDLRRGSSLTVEGLVMGTPNYMAPEQATGESTLDGRADLYALGISAFEMLTGQLPFKDDSPMVVLTMHVNDDVPLASTIRVDLAPATCAIVDGLCQRNRDLRYHHAKGAIADIDHVIAIGQTGRSASAASLPSRARTPATRAPSSSPMPAAGRTPARHTPAPGPPMRTRSSSGDMAVATPSRTPRGRSPTSRRLASMRTSSQRLAAASSSPGGPSHQLVPVVIAVGSAALVVGLLMWLSNRPTSPRDESAGSSASKEHRSQLVILVERCLATNRFREAAAAVFDRERQNLNAEDLDELSQLQDLVREGLKASIEAQIVSGQYSQAMTLLEDIAAEGQEARHETSGLISRVKDQAAEAEKLAITQLLDSVPYKCRALDFDAANEEIDSAPLVSDEGRKWHRLLRDMVREVEDLATNDLKLSADKDRLPSLGDLLALLQMEDLMEPGLGLGPLAGEALISTERSWQGPTPLAKRSGVVLERLLQKSSCMALSLSRDQELAVIVEVARRHELPLNPLLVKVSADLAEAAKQRVTLAETAGSLLDTDGDLKMVEESLEALAEAPALLGEPGTRRREALRMLARARRLWDQGNVEQIIAESALQLPVQDALWPIEWLELMAASTTASMVEKTRQADIDGLEGAADEAEQVLAQAQQAGVSPSSHGGPLGRDLERSIADARRYAKILNALRDLGRELEQTQPEFAAVNELVTSVAPIKSVCQEILSGPSAEQGPSPYAGTIRGQLTATTVFVESMEQLIQPNPQAAELTLDSISLIDPEGHFTSAFQREITALRKLIQAGAEVMARAEAEAARRREPTPPEPDGGGAPPPAEPAKPETATTERIVVADKDDLKRGFKGPNTWNWEGGLINNARNEKTFRQLPLVLSPNGGRVRQVSLLIDLEQQHQNNYMPVLAISACGFTCFISQDKLGLHAGGPNGDWMSAFVNNLYDEANLELAPANPNNPVRPWQRGIYVLDIKVADLGTNQPNGLEVTVTLSEQNARRPDAKLNLIVRAPASKRKRGQVQLHLFQQYHVTDLTVVRERPADEKESR